MCVRLSDRVCQLENHWKDLDEILYTILLEATPKPYFLVEISGSQGDEYEDGCLLGCCAVQSGSALMMEAVSSSEMSVSIYQTTSQKTSIFIKTKQRTRELVRWERH
jgi:hypothetical protein